MEKDKIGGFFSDISKNAKEKMKKTKDKAVEVVDQNDDGKLNLKDVAALTNTIGNAVKKGTGAVKDTADEKRRNIEKKMLQPIFPEELDATDFFLTKFIRVTERDKKYSESDVCQGSIGYMSEQKGLRYVNIFRDSLDAYGTTFYPDRDSEFYYIDPSDRDHYIALDEYFGFLKVARITELQKIAQALGAKHFKVTYKEEKTMFSETKKKAKKEGKISSEVDVDTSEKQYSAVEIASEMDFPGHAPSQPDLKYLQRDPSIQALVSMRLNEDTPLLHQKFMLKMSNSSGLKENDAIKIDAVLKSLKFSGNATVASEAKNETRRYLEYEIDF